MKISALKKMIKEAVREAVREEMSLLEQRSIQRPVLEQNETSGLEELRRKFKKSQPKENSLYEDIGGKSAADPQNPKVIKDGEVFASGKGIMEWFQDSKDEEALDNLEEQKKKMAKTDEYLKGVFGRKL